ncbi:hypothetical protein QBC44DRAFT_316260 [Cladorrhinum sp. PSN332]|nr:hypothetical protein QBC44DRAFT_316260 [Cladorrhinum sp. PSN332]
MSRGGKAITIGLVVALGIANGYYSFAPALRDEKDKRAGTYLSKTLEPQTPVGQQSAPKQTRKD